MLISLSLNITLPDGRKVEKPCLEWFLHQIRWRWLMDSYEGGESYRTAEYGVDMRGFPIRNLIRHKREYPDPRQYPLNTSIMVNRPAGSDQYGAAGDNDDYQLRLARTPVPTFLAEVLETHLSQIFNDEIDRDTNDSGIEDWWLDVDGKGTTIDRWMADTIAPILLALGQLDLIFDHPATTEDVTTRADVQRLGLDTCVAGYILPDNMVWWQIDRKGAYIECLVREVSADDPAESNYRYWNDKGWWLFNKDGQKLKQGDHPFRRVPIVRVFDRRRPRSPFVGLPRYETIAELQREYFNRDSELILSDTIQAHPLIQGPEDYVQADGTIPLGPGWLLPMKKDSVGGSASYQGFEVIDFPKGAAESIRMNLAGIRDRVDRAAQLTKPAGASGTGATTVSQSGVSKQLDSVGGNKLLTKIAQVLKAAEETMVKFVNIVLSNGKPNQATIDGTTITYPSEFDLMSTDELAKNIGDFQLLLASAGRAPETEEELLCRLIRGMLPGLDDEDYAELDKEISAYLEGAAADQERMKEASVSGMEAMTQNPNEAPDAGTESGESESAAPAAGYAAAS